MATFSELQTRVLTRIVDVTSAIQSEIPTLINDAMRTLQHEHNYEVMEARTSALTTTVGTLVLTARPSDWKSARGQPVMVENLGRVKELTYTPNREQAQRLFSIDPDIDIGEPELLLMSEPSDELNTRNIEVFPYPDGASDYSDGEYRIYIPYWKYLADLSDDSDENWFTVHGAEYLIRKATSEAFYLMWDETRAKVWAMRADDTSRGADGKKRELENLDKRTRVESIRSIPYYTGARSIRTGI